MKIKVGGFTAVIGLVVLWFGVPAFGQDVTIDFTGIKNTSVQTLGSYAGYYTGTVNGVAEAPGFICDDYNDEIFLPSHCCFVCVVGYDVGSDAGQQHLVW